jgi:hypothetical protein
LKNRPQIGRNFDNRKICWAQFFAKKFKIHLR